MTLSSLDRADPGATPAVSPPSPLPALALDPLVGRHVLVVDDTDSARTILQTMLTRAGMRVSQAADADQALHSVRRPAHDIDVVLMDLVLDDADGIVLIRQLRPLLPTHVPVLAMTASPSADVEARCRAAGAEPGLLAKPFRSHDVLGAVRQALLRRATWSAPTAPPEPAPVPPVPAWATLADPVRGVAPVRPDLALTNALDRCGGDVALLRRMLERFRDDGPNELTLARTALQAGQHRAASRRLHRIRGELLNLGQQPLAEHLLIAEKALQATPDHAEIACPCVNVEPLSPGRDARCVDDIVASVLGQLRRFVDEALQSPLLDVDEAASSRTVDADAPGRFAALYQAMTDNDAAALRLESTLTRLLPARYGENAAAQFRQHLDALDFAAALALLDDADRPTRSIEASDTGHRLLVVDDAPLTVRLLCRTLDGLGRVRFALSAESALEIAASWQPHLILTDVNMGQMSGIELCRQIKRMPQTASTAVILVSADHDVASEVEALTAGAADFIEKPLKPARIVGRVTTQLNQVRRVMELATMAGGELRSAPIGFLTCTVDGDIIDVNPPLAAWLGQSMAALRGATLADVLDLSSMATLPDCLLAMRHEGRLAPREARLVGADRVPLPVRMVGWSVPSPQGRVIWIAVEDLRDRLQDERRRIEAQMSQTLMTLCGGIAHEFNNLLNVTIGHLDLALENEGRLQQRAWLTKANEAALRAADISRRLDRTARRIGGGQDTVAHLDTLIDEFWPLLLTGVPRQVVLLRRPSKHALPVRVDAVGLRHALTQLLRNAYEAMPQGGEVVVSTRLEPATDAGPGRAVLEVQDAGCGMDEATRRHAFDPFFTTKAPAQAGLGLSQVQGYATSQRGTAVIDSAPGRGTTVRLYLDLAQATLPS